MKFASAVVAFATMSVASGAICEMDSPIAEGMEQVSGTLTVLVVLDSQNSDTTNPVLLTRLSDFFLLSQRCFSMEDGPQVQLDPSKKSLPMLRMPKPLVLRLSMERVETLTFPMVT